MHTVCVLSNFCFIQNMFNSYTTFFCYYFYVPYVWHTGLWTRRCISATFQLLSSLTVKFCWDCTEMRKTSHRWESVDLRLICLPSVLQVFMLWWFLSCCLVMIMFMSIQQHVVADTLFTDQLCSSVMCRKGASILMHTVSVKCHPNIPTCRLKTTHNVSSNQNPVLKLDIIQIPGSKIRHKERQT